MLDIDGTLFFVVEFQHIKPGKGGAFVRTKLKNVVTGRVIERTWNAGEKVKDVRLDRVEMQYLYRSGDEYHFMNNQTYDQMTLPAEMLEEAAPDDQGIGRGHRADAGARGDSGRGCRLRGPQGR